MLLDLMHQNLGWPSPREIREPVGDGIRVFSDLVQAKIGSAISLMPDGENAKVGVLLRNSKALTTDAPLAVVVEFKTHVSDQTLRELHRLAWNFSHSPAMVTIEPDLLRVWTCCEPPDDGRYVGGYVVDRLETKDISSPSLESRAAQALHWVNLVSGQFFQERAERFKRDQRADQMLLGNLRHVRDKLHKAGLDDDDVCHDLLARIVFVQFLFDRKDSRGNPALTATKLATLHKEGTLKKLHADFSSILENYAETYRLFEWLNGIFNGDLFPGKGDTPRERELGWRAEKKVVKPAHLNLLSEFIKGNLDMPSGQLCLWPQYAFDVIPLEFISSIYEAFVTERASDGGIYYTPPHLVDFILDRVLPWNGKQWNLKILDPACGSGIFLVKAFQRLVYRWKQNNPNQTIRAEVLRGMLERNIFGVDKDPHAVRVASFSLYLAMCDEIDPRHYWTQVVFPAMRERSLINSDFFEEGRAGFQTVEDAETYDLVIGNAPWGENLLTDSAKEWAVHENHCWPLANKGIGTLFLPKAAAMTKPEGRIAMIQSASSLLFNRSGKAIAFRQRFFSTFTVEELVNLSALRFKVFNRKTHSEKSSIAPSCVVIFKPCEPGVTHRLSYISPKQAESLVDEFEIAVEPHDVKVIGVQEASYKPEIWTAFMWGGRRDWGFLNRLRDRLTLESLHAEKKYEIREGLIPKEDGDPYPETIGRKFWQGKTFPPGTFLFLEAGQVDEAANGIRTHRRTSLEAFKTPQLVLKQGWQKAAGRFVAAITSPISPVTEDGILFNQSYLSIHAPRDERPFLEAASLSYNSIFATYFLLLTSSRFASYRPEPLVEELLRVPIPEPRQGLLDELHSYVDVDRRIREAFDFKDAEWALIEDLFNYTLPDFKGDVASPGRRRTDRMIADKVEPQLSSYCEYLVRVLKAGFGQDKQIAATIFQEPEGRLPYRLVAFELEQPSDKQVRIKSISSPDLLNELERLNASWLRQYGVSGGGIYHQRVARIYDHRNGMPTIFILKPDACRYWTRSMGLYDGDEIAADFFRWQEAEAGKGRH